MFSLGVDVSKAKLDCLLLDGSTGKQRDKTVANTPAGVRSLLKWLEERGVVVSELVLVMEPTGVYHELAAQALHEAGVRVHLINPARARNYALSLGQRDKTDAADCRSLAHMGLHQRLPRWSPPSPSARMLKALLARRAALAEDLQRESNRLEKAQATLVPRAVSQSIAQGIAFIEQQLKTLDRQIKEHIDGDDELRAKRELLRSIDGVGPRLADEFTAILGCMRFDSAQALACYLGLTPQRWESGSSVRGRSQISKAGPARLRAVLYMPAVVAKKHNRHVRELYERLLAAGKPKMLAITAAMRKLVHLCFGVVHSNQPYDPAYGATQG
jgi:transposase